MLNADLLIEIGTEELPPKALPTLSSAFDETFASQLKLAGLNFASVQRFATPRRLALLVTQLDTEQAARTLEKWGPAVQAAFGADGKPSKAAEGFARSCGVDVSALEQRSDGKVTKLYYGVTHPGAATATLIPAMVQDALAALPIPKRMRWGSSRDEFVRPVQWVVLLLGDSVIDAVIMGQRTGNTSRGHRFMHTAPLTLTTPAQYQSTLQSGKVIADFTARRAQVRQQIEAKALELKGRAIIDEALLDEVTALVEWPVALAGRFDEAFLNVPKEALISSMKEHQKCFHLLDADNRILPYFITLSNLASRDPAQVIAGNEKVIRPRLADAAFFFNQDRRQPLSARIEKLKTVVFQQDLGTLYDKTQRVKYLAVALAKELGYDAALAARAAELGKCDLMTSMVYEFAELQGIMGQHYARHDGEPEDVALALNEQYLPRFAGDLLPTSRTGRVLALAERLDTIAGLFGLGQPPTGSKDPFALRRAALGVLRLIIEQQLPLSLPRAVSAAMAGFDGNAKVKDASQDIVAFINERLRAYYADQHIAADVFLAVDAVRPQSPLEFDARIKAVAHFATLTDAQALASANKRVGNILQKAATTPPAQCSTALLQEPAEHALATALYGVRAVADPLLASSRFTEALATMATLRAPVDAFFDQVMVNAEDPALRHNRLALLSELRQLFLRIADISLLQNV
ncbi:MAG: glycine--tRNA ligase subunit beta [Pseudomonadales bacterium]|jgi:glycyl-tRNA synthetase beta chain|nr:glycine--tRNA ligase subunit beta [Pseudomonadales bacterium]